MFVHVFDVFYSSANFMYTFIIAHCMYVLRVNVCLYVVCCFKL